MDLIHSGNRSHWVANSTTFSTTTHGNRLASAARSTHHAVARVISKASGGSCRHCSSSSKRASCAGSGWRFFPPAGLISVQMTEAHMMVALGSQRMG
ncbi:hypothetical protein M2271_002242 [Streptomyces sp. LBL]|nr:hypothetical protein [Streptomyces sp. LBL]